VPTFKEQNEKLESWSRWNWQDVTADWTWKGYEDSLVEIEAYSSCDSVELYLNDQLLGKKATGRSEKYMASFKVPYKTGVLKAKGYTASKKVAEAILQTAPDPSAIKLTADRKKLIAAVQDLSYITVEITDANGIRNPKAESLVNFTIEGPATIAAVSNANPKSTGSFQSSRVKSWQGRCLVIVMAGTQTGDIILHATSPGLAPASLTLQSSL
jgi:beta-galactosidase